MLLKIMLLKFNIKLKWMFLRPGMEFQCYNKQIQLNTKFINPVKTGIN